MCCRERVTRSQQLDKIIDLLSEPLRGGWGRQWRLAPCPRSGLPEKAGGKPDQPHHETPRSADDRARQGWSGGLVSGGLRDSPIRSGIRIRGSVFHSRRVCERIIRPEDPLLGHRVPLILPVLKWEGRNCVLDRRFPGGWCPRDPLRGGVALARPPDSAPWSFWVDGRERGDIGSRGKRDVLMRMAGLPDLQGLGGVECRSGPPLAFPVERHPAAPAPGGSAGSNTPRMDRCLGSLRKVAMALQPDLVAQVLRLMANGFPGFQVPGAVSMGFSDASAGCVPGRRVRWRECPPGWTTPVEVLWRGHSSPGWQDPGSW